MALKSIHEKNKGTDSTASLAAATVSPDSCYFHSAEEEDVAAVLDPSVLQLNSVLPPPRIRSSSFLSSACIITCKKGVKRKDSIQQIDPASDDPKTSKATKKMMMQQQILSRKRQKTATIDKLATSCPASSLQRRTVSFDAVWAGTFDSQTTIKPHTLILGSHPSIASLERQQYYANPVNAFWWIAGDCLGFRRDKGFSKSAKNIPFKFASLLRYGPEHIISYDQQLHCLTSKGFALWDVVQSCRRQGSLDQDIRDEIPNDIREFCCQQHPSIRRIVLANGGTGSKLFVKHFESWFFQSDELEVLDHEFSQRAFAATLRKISKCNKSSSKVTCAAAPALAKSSTLPLEEPKPSLLLSSRTSTSSTTNSGSFGRPRKITLISAMSVSPAAATYSYAEKRDFWEEYVYRPGLQDYHADTHDDDNNNMSNHNIVHEDHLLNI